MAIEKNEFMNWLRERVSDDDFNEANEFFTGYMQENDNYRESAEARMTEYANSEAAMKEDIQSLKARNYDLLMQVPADETQNGDDSVVDTVTDDGTLIHIDNLFTDPTKKEDN